MLFVVYFKDSVDRYDTRKKYLKSHIQWLKDHQHIVLVGGSLREQLDHNPVGGLWIVESESKLGVEALIEIDPFWIHKLRSNYQILHWSKAFPNETTLV